MIQFQITQSPDSDVIGIEQIDKNIITFGCRHSDILIKDDLISSLILELKISEENILTAKPVTEQKKFWVNKKIYTFEKKVNAMDVVKIGETEIKIISFNFSPAINFNEVTVKKLEELYNQNSPIIELLNQFEQQIRDKNE